VVDLTSEEVEFIKEQETSKQEREDAEKAAAEELLNVLPMKRAGLKKAVKIMAKCADMLILYSDADAKARGIYYLGRVNSYHPMGMAVLGPDNEDIPRYCIVGTNQLPQMTRLLQAENFDRIFTTDKEQACLFIRPSGQLD